MTSFPSPFRGYNLPFENYFPSLSLLQIYSLRLLKKHKDLANGEKGAATWEILVSLSSVETVKAFILSLLALAKTPFCPFQRSGAVDIFVRGTLRLKKWASMLTTRSFWKRKKGKVTGLEAFFGVEVQSKRTGPRRRMEEPKSWNWPWSLHWCEHGG